MINLNLKGVDLQKAETGVPIPYENGIIFQIARANTPDYKKAVRRIAKLHKRQLDSGTLDDNEAEMISAELMARHILVGWTGMKDGKKDFPYTFENAVLFLSDKRYAEIRDWIMMQAQDIENFRSEEVKK